MTSRRRRRTSDEVWSGIGAQAPDWGVLTNTRRPDSAWDDNLDAFYETGRIAVREALDMLDPATTGRARAVDWGCGTGRLSFALAAEFAEVHAFDVSPGMLSTARERAAQRDIQNVHFHHLDDEVPPLEVDFALSLIVLQHLEKREHVRTGIRSIIEHLKAGGHAVVEIPDRILTRSSRLQPRFRLYRLARRLGISAARLYAAGLHGMSVLAVPEQDSRQLFAECGAEVLSVAKHEDGNYRYVRYLVRRV